MMNQLNSILMEGNLVRDPEIKTTPGGAPVCNFSIASNRYLKRENEKEHQQEVSYFDIQVWHRLAENCEKYLQKGKGVRVVGRLKQDRWNDKEGNPRNKVYIVGEQVEFIPSRKKAEDLPSDKKQEETPVF